MKNWFYIFGLFFVGVVVVISVTVWFSHRKMTLHYVHAEGDDEGEPMTYLPNFTPQDGKGKGPPIYDCPRADLLFTLSPTDVSGIRTVFVRYLGGLYALVETVPGSLVFTDSIVRLALSDPMADDSCSRKWTSTSVTIPVLGITNAVYPCIETSADSSVFENYIYGLVFTVETPPSVLRTATLHTVTVFSTTDMELMETATGAGIFTNGNLSVKLMSIAGTPRLSITDGFFRTNAIFSVWETTPQSGVYRNYHPPIPTDLSADDLKVPDFVPWRIKIKGVTNPALVSEATLTTSVDCISRITFSAVDGSLLSDQKFILIPDRNLDATPPQGYVPLRVNTLESRWWDKEQKDVSLSVTLASEARALGATSEKRTSKGDGVKERRND